MKHAYQKATLPPGFFPRVLQQFIPFLIAIVFIAVIYLYFPFRNRLQFDEDEGINLMKASLIMKGYQLFEQIWSDQPPLLTYRPALDFAPVEHFAVKDGPKSSDLLSKILLAGFHI